MKLLKPGQLVGERIEELEAEVERLRAERAGDQQRLFHYECKLALLADTAAFLDRLAERLQRLVACDVPVDVGLSAAECRVLARELRGETTGYNPPPQGPTGE